MDKKKAIAKKGKNGVEIWFEDKIYHPATQGTFNFKIIPKWSGYRFGSRLSPDPSSLGESQSIGGEASMVDQEHNVSVFGSKGVLEKIDFLITRTEEDEWGNLDFHRGLQSDFDEVYKIQGSIEINLQKNRFDLLLEKIRANKDLLIKVRIKMSAVKCLWTDFKYSEPNEVQNLVYFDRWSAVHIPEELEDYFEEYQNIFHYKNAFDLFLFEDL